MSEPRISYLETLRRSQLVPRKTIDAVVAELNSGDAPDESQLANRMLEQGLITEWQHKKLQEGRYDGFFLSKYKLLDHLGTGGMGAVFLAEHKRMGHKVAMKILPPDLTENPQLLGRFYQEAKATAALDHPNIVRAHDVDEASGIHFIVMEYIEGENLEQQVRRNGYLPYKQVAEAIRQAAAGLAHAHAKRLIHRDIKPSNLVLDVHGIVKVMDMGIARILEQGDEDSLTLQGHEEMLGTVDFIAPEQFEDPHNVDARADLYSLGCTMFFLLTGRAPFDEGTMTDRLLAHQAQAPPDLRQVRSDIPKGLVEICLKLMEKKKEDRYQTANELGQALTDWLKSVDQPQSSQPTEGEEAAAEPPAAEPATESPAVEPAAEVPAPEPMPEEPPSTVMQDYGDMSAFVIATDTNIDYSTLDAQPASEQTTSTVGGNADTVTNATAPPPEPAVSETPAAPNSPEPAPQAPAPQAVAEQEAAPPVETSEVDDTPTVLEQAESDYQAARQKAPVKMGPYDSGDLQVPNPLEMGSDAHSSFSISISDVAQAGPDGKLPDYKQSEEPALSASEAPAKKSAFSASADTAAEEDEELEDDNDSSTSMLLMVVFLGVAAAVFGFALLLFLFR